MKLTNPRQINKDDFNEQYSDLIDGLATPINSQATETYNCLDNNVDFTYNINATIATFQASVTSDGTVNSSVVFKLKPTQKTTQGVSVLSLKDNTGTPIIPAGAPYVTAVQDGDTMIVKNIKGLDADTQYSICVLVI